MRGLLSVDLFVCADCFGVGGILKAFDEKDSMVHGSSIEAIVRHLIVAEIISEVVSLSWAIKTKVLFIVFL